MRGWARAFAASPDCWTPLDALFGLGGSQGSEAWDKDVDTDKNQDEYVEKDKYKYFDTAEDKYVDKDCQEF